MHEKLSQAREAGKISEVAATNASAWLANEQLAGFHGEIQRLIDEAQWEALEDAFYTQIEFGTAGIRGRTGLGSTRINAWTVGTAAQGLADYVKTKGDANRGVVIGSDTRITSPEFVQLVSNILTSNGIKVFQFKNPPQVGMFSFAVRLYKAQAGVYISASHNPPTDNGLKIYWEDGAQVLPPHDKAVTEAVKQVSTIKKDSPNESLITWIDEAFDDTYRARVLHESVYEGRSAKIVYSPFHGTGQYGVLPTLRDAGFEVVTVDEQMTPDGNFPNVPGGTPNPENKAANELTAKKVLETGADLGISTDPDADRLGLVVPKDGQTVILDGNQTVVLLTYFICTALKEQDKLPKNGFLVRNLTTTKLVDSIGEAFGLTVYKDVPVGFKYIGELMNKYEDFGDQLHLYSGEESFGSIKGSYAHDKDASSAALIAAEMMSWLKDTGKTVWDLFDEIYATHGYFDNHLVNIFFEGASGFAKMTKLMDGLRNTPPQQIGEWPVVRMIDRKTNEIKDSSGAVVGKVEDHTTNALVFELSEDGKSSVIIRPSGTEPKVKLYTSIYKATEGQDAQKVTDEAKTATVQLEAALKALVDQLTA